VSEQYLANPVQKIAIIGCGPGGLSSALFLVRQGHEVTLFERFAEPRPVGSGLLIQPSGQEILESLRLLDKVKALSSPVHHLHGISIVKNRRALDMRYENTRSGIPALGIHRASLFSVLMDAVKAANIPIIVNSELVAVEEIHASIKPVFANSAVDADYDLLIDASGARSPLASGRSRNLKYGAFWATVDMPADHRILPDALDQRYFRASKMAGIMPIGINPATVNPGAAIFWSEKPEKAADVIDAGIACFREEYCKLWPEAEPFVGQIKSMDELTMAVYAHRTDHSQMSRRMFRVGDSWHCTSP